MHYTFECNNLYLNLYILVVMKINALHTDVQFNRNYKGLGEWWCVGKGKIEAMSFGVQCLIQLVTQGHWLYTQLHVISLLLELLMILLHIHQHLQQEKHTQTAKIILLENLIATIILYILALLPTSHILLLIYIFAFLAIYIVLMKHIVK